MIFLLIINIIFVAFLGLLTYFLINQNLFWWLRSQRTKNILKNFWPKLSYLELKMPREVTKSPAAMEFMFNALNQTLGHVDLTFKEKREKDKEWKKKKLSQKVDEYRSYWQDRYLNGGVRMWSSLEIVSEEGQVKFYIVMLEKHVGLVKNALYGQYNGIEIVESKNDYLDKFAYTKQNEGDWNLYVGRYQKKQDKETFKYVQPIKTYVDYGLEKDPKDEFKIDPLNTVLEAFANAGKGENFVLQILIRGSIADGTTYHHGHAINYQADTFTAIEKIKGIKRAEEDTTIEEEIKGEKKPKKIKKGDIVENGKSEMQLTTAEKESIEALNKNLTKPCFDTIIRMFYIAKKEKFNLSSGVFPVVYTLKNFNKPNFGELGFTSLTLDSDYLFKDPTGVRSEGMRGFFWKMLKLRAGFYVESEGIHFSLKSWFKRRFGKGGTADWAATIAKENVLYFSEGIKHPGTAGDSYMNAEELATLFHVPSKIQGNTQGRVDSIKVDPPANLPF